MIHITHDVFDISWRMKSIDSEYELFYNRKAHRYEVYIGGKLQSIIPYDTLDVRTLNYLRRTRRENVEKLLASIEADNAKLDRERDAEIRRRAECRLEEVLR